MDQTKLDIATLIVIVCSYQRIAKEIDYQITTGISMKLPVHSFVSIKK